MTPEARKQEVKACKCCGFERSEIGEYSTGPGYHGYDNVTWHYRHCLRCGYTAESSSDKQKSEDNWNNRPTPAPALTEEQEAVVGEAEMYIKANAAMPYEVQKKIIQIIRNLSSKQGDREAFLTELAKKAWPKIAPIHMLIEADFINLIVQCAKQGGEG